MECVVYERVYSVSEDDCDIDIYLVKEGRNRYWMIKIKYDDIVWSDIGVNSIINIKNLTDFDECPYDEDVIEIVENILFVLPDYDRLYALAVPIS
jgi:hypothetical protein